MCDCVNVELGSYDNVVLLKPFWKDEEVQIDKCLKEEILFLWKLGIKTAASCCGHNKIDPVIAVYPKYKDKMIELGYEKCVFEGDWCCCPDDCFYPKSIRRK